MCGPLATGGHRRFPYLSIPPLNALFAVARGGDAKGGDAGPPPLALPRLACANILKAPTGPIVVLWV